MSSYSQKKLLTGASVYSFGEILIKVSGFFLIPIFTRILTPADYGIIGYLQVFLQIATVIVTFGLYSSQTRFIYEQEVTQKEIGSLLFTINGSISLVALLILVPVTIAAYFSDLTIGASDIPFMPYMVLTLWTVFFQVLANNAVNYYRAKQQYAVTTVLQVSRFFAITLWSLLLIVHFDLGALGRIAGLFAGMLTFLLVSYPFYVRHFVFRPSLKLLKYAVTFGLPIVVHQLANTVHNAIDRFMLESFVPLEELGIYTLGFTIGATMNVFIASFNKAYQPMYFQHMSGDANNKQAAVIKTFNIWLILVTSIAVAGMLLGTPFLSVFAGPSFQATTAIFPWVILAMFMGGFYYFFVSPIFYYKKTKYLPVITGISALINISFNFWLIPLLGIIGAAYATILSHAVQSIVALIISQRLYKMQWPYVNILISLAVVSTALFINIRIL